MCGESWYILTATLKLGCVMLFCAFLLLIAPGCGYEQWKLAAALSETPQGLLLIAIIAAALIDGKRG